MLIYGFHRTFLQVISFLQVKLVSQKDNCRKNRSYLSRKSNKIKTSNVQNFCFWKKCIGTSKGKWFIERKKWVTVHSRELSTFTDVKLTTTTLFVDVSYSARALDA